MRRFWFFWFFLIFQLYLHQLLYFKMHTDHVNSTLTSSTRVTLLHHCQQWCLFFFPHFLAIFTSVTILGNLHRPCNQCIKIIKRVYIMSILFFLIFPDHFNIFAWLTILENAHRWCKQYTNIVEDGLCNAAPFFSDVLGIFASITILGNVHRPCK